MKNGKRPTVAQKRLMAAKKLNPADWMVVKDTPATMLIVHRHCPGTTREIHKEG